eukprot:gene26897-4508_t
MSDSEPVEAAAAEMNDQESPTQVGADATTEGTEPLAAAEGGDAARSQDSVDGDIDAGDSATGDSGEEEEATSSQGADNGGAGPATAAEGGDRPVGSGEGLEEGEDGQEEEVATVGDDSSGASKAESVKGEPDPAPGAEGGPSPSPLSMPEAEGQLEGATSAPASPSSREKQDELYRLSLTGRGGADYTQSAPTTPCGGCKTTMRSRRAAVPWGKLNMGAMTNGSEGGKRRRRKKRGK